MTRFRKLTSLDKFYLGSRLGAALGLSVLFLSDILPFKHDVDKAFFAVGISVMVLVGIVSILAYMETFGLTRRRMLWTVLPFDLISVALLIIATEGSEDPFYPWIFGVPIVYAVFIRKREAWIVSALAAVIYFAVHVSLHTEPDIGSFIFVLMKTLALPFVGFLVADVTSKSAQRERDLVRARQEMEDLNDRLGRRLAELHAISEITEVIHSTLDFDEIGPMVLDTLKKAIDLPACCLFVIDKDKSETLFSVSDGVRPDDRWAAGLAGGIGPAIGDEYFACLNVLDHNNMMVVFCAESGYMESMAAEDRLVLQAVAGELVVAVENWQLYRLTKRLAITDELTGLYNYRYLQQRLDDEYERACRYGRSLSLLMIDVDDFKAFNDTHQHVAGDTALSEVAEVLREATREIDVVARYGGEEFSVLLPETDAAGAYVVAEKIRESVAMHLFPNAKGHHCVNLTVSIGLATYPDHAIEREDLLRQADDALFDAKHGGRDRVRSAESLQLRVLKTANDEE